MDLSGEFAISDFIHVSDVNCLPFDISVALYFTFVVGAQEHVFFVLNLRLEVLVITSFIISLPGQFTEITEHFVSRKQSFS